MQKKLSLLVLALGTLVAAAVYLSLNAGKTEMQSPLADSAASIQGIAISRDGMHVDLKKIKGSWRMESPVADWADSHAVMTLLDSFKNLSVGSEVAENPSSDEAYGLNPASAAVVTLSGAGGHAVFSGVFGKEAIGFNSAYFRYAGKHPVYLATGVSPFQILRSTDAYRERAFLPQGLAAWDSITLASGGKSYELTRSTHGWSSKPKLKGEALDPLVATVFNMRVSSFESKKPLAAASGFSSPILTIDAQGRLGHTRWVVGKAKPFPGSKQSYDRYAECPDRGVIALVSIYDVDSLLRVINPAPTRPSPKKPGPKKQAASSPVLPRTKAVSAPRKAAKAS